MAFGAITNIGTPSAGSSGTTQAITVATAPTAPTLPGIFAGVSLRDAGNTANPSCADSRGNVYTRIKVQNTSGVTEGCIFYSSGVTPLVDGDSITISGLTASSARIMAAGYVESMGTLFGSATAAQLTGTGSPAASGNVTDMPNPSVAIGMVGWSNQSPQDTFITITSADGDYASDLTGGATSEGSGNGIDRAIYFGNRVISSLTTDGFTNGFSAACIWTSILAVFNEATAGATGTAAQTLPSLTQAASGTSLVNVSGAASQTLPALTQDAAGTALVNASGTAAQNFPSLAQAASGTSGGAPTFSSNFERASFNPTGSSISGVGDDAVISINPALQESEIVTGTTRLRWLFPVIAVLGVRGFRPSFEFLNYATPATDGKYHGTSWQTGRRPVFSYDGVTWTAFDTNVTIGTGIEFRHSVAFSAGADTDPVYIGWGPTWTPTEVTAWIDGLETTYPTLIHETISTVDFVADTFSAQTDELSNVSPALPLHAFLIRDDSLTPAAGVKRTFVFTFGMHAGEDLGDLAFRAAIDFLLGSDAAAQNVRQHANIYVYGPLNAPGRYLGGWRGSFTQGTDGADDGNRHFSDGDGGGLEIVNKPRDAMTADLPDAVQMLIDWHGAWSTKYGVFAPNAVRAALLTAIGTYAPGTVTDLGAGSSGTVKEWFQNTYGTTWNMTSEIGMPTPTSDADVVLWGEAHVKALSDLITSNDIPLAPIGGTAAQMLPALQQAAAGTSILDVTGTAAQTLPSLGQAAAGTGGDIIYSAGQVSGGMLLSVGKLMGR